MSEGNADSAEPPDPTDLEEDAPWFVVTDEPDVDDDEMVAIMRKAAGAYGVRPHPDRVEKLQRHLDEQRAVMPPALYEVYERSVIVRVHIQAIDAYTGFGNFHIVGENGVSTGEWNHPSRWADFGE